MGLVVKPAEMLLIEAEKALAAIKVNHYLATGHNGPYRDPETRVRVDAHWIQIFEFLFAKTGDEKYRSAILCLAEDMLDLQKESSNYSFKCRNKKGKDHVNGTIGQAWAIEGLLASYRVLRDQNFLDLAINLFYQHEFDEKRGTWRRQEIDGSDLGYDLTYNHQLWFAAAGCEILKLSDEEAITSQVVAFLEKSEATKLFSVYSDGLIRHIAYPWDSLGQMGKRFVKRVHNDSLDKQGKPSLRYKEAGYHSFCMYGFALIHEVIPNAHLFECGKFQKALKYATDINSYKSLLLDNHSLDSTGLTRDRGSLKSNLYSYSYNSPAFEMPFVLKEFCGEIDRDLVEYLWAKQIELTYDIDAMAFREDEEDAITLASRLYEMCRCPELFEW